MSCGSNLALAGFVAALAGLLLGASDAAAEEIRGRARVVAANEIEVAGTTVRLAGIRVPRPDQCCRIGAGSYDCGRVAADALRDLTTGTNVRCIVRGENAAGKPIATCLADGYDLSEGMVYTGWAAAEPDNGRRYLALEWAARAAHRGLWRGEFAGEERAGNR
jgi:endonuclease YncB( thermonuclease family)